MKSGDDKKNKTTETGKMKKILYYVSTHKTAVQSHFLLPFNLSWSTGGIDGAELVNDDNR